MASITKRGNSYLIRVSDLYSADGKQIIKSKTWKIPEGMSAKKAEKEALQVAALFEDQVKKGLLPERKIKFSEFVQTVWLEDYVKLQLRDSTLDFYSNLIPELNQAFGQYPIDKIKPVMLTEFYKKLATKNKATTYKAKIDIDAYLEKHNLKRKELARKAEVGTSTIDYWCQGKSIRKDTATKIATALGEKFSYLFTEAEAQEKISSTTVAQYHKALSSIFTCAVQNQYIAENPCRRVKPPKINRDEALFLDDKQSIELLELLNTKLQAKYDETIIYKTAVEVLLYTGMRRGEALGLEWADIDETHHLLSIQKSLQYRPHEGLQIEETKTKSSKRIIQVPVEVIDSLDEYKQWKIAKYKEAGSDYIPSGLIFTSLEGVPLHPCTLTSWFHDFIAETDLPQIHIHSLRHTNATLMIANNVPLTTVASSLGHCNSSTTSKVYAHAIQSADAMKADILHDIFKKNRKADIVEFKQA